MKIIPTSKGNHAIVDDEDYEWLSKFKWVDSDGYTVTSTYLDNGEYKQNLRMHRIILNVPEDKVVDHINGNRSDNRKENLRIVNTIQNAWNSGKRSGGTSQFKGVSKSNGKYIVKIKYNSNKEHIGTFENELAAANAYNYFAKEYFGEYARLNEVKFMDKQEWEQYKSKSTSNYRGVSWAKDVRKWSVQIWDGDDGKFVGYFEDEIIAANYFNHLMKKEINKCEYISLEECEKRKHKRKKTSKYRGVSWESRKSKWEVNIWNGNKKHFVGYFDSEEDAALSFNTKAIELNVKYLDRKLNVIKGEENEHELKIS